MPIGAAIAAGVGGLAQASAARRAAAAQTDSANRQLAVQERMHEQSRADLAPYRESGIPATNALNYYLGVGGRPTDTNFVGFEQTPGFQFAMDEGLGAVEASAAARGGLYSGAAMEALQQRGMGLARQEFGNYLSRLEGTATRGQNAAAQSATVNTNTASMQTNALGQMANAQSAGIVGQANALNNSIDNGIGLWGYMTHMNRKN